MSLLDCENIEPSLDSLLKNLGWSKGVSYIPLSLRSGHLLDVSTCPFFQYIDQFLDGDTINQTTLKLWPKGYMCVLNSKVRTFRKTIVKVEILKYHRTLGTSHLVTFWIRNCEDNIIDMMNDCKVLKNPKEYKAKYGKKYATQI